MASNFAAKGKGKGNEAKRLPDNMSVLVTRLTTEKMEMLILKSIMDGAALTSQDVLDALDGQKILTQKEKERKLAMPDAENGDEDEKAKQTPTLKKMCTFTKKELDHDFARFDKNGDGSVTLDEFIEIMNRNNSEPFPEVELVQIFQEMDVDGGGTVCYHEFAERWAADREMDATE